MGQIEEYFTISWAKDPVRVARGQAAAATRRAKQQAKKRPATGPAAAAAKATTRAQAAAAKIKARAQAAASRQRRVQAAKRRIARAQLRQADSNVRAAARATQRAARGVTKARAALQAAKAALTQAVRDHRSAGRAETRATKQRAKVARRVGRFLPTPTIKARSTPAPTAAPPAAPGVAFAPTSFRALPPMPPFTVAAPAPGANARLGFAPISPPGVPGFAAPASGWQWRVVGPGTFATAAPQQRPNGGFAAFTAPSRPVDEDEDVMAIIDDTPRPGFDDEGAFYEGPPMESGSLPATWKPLVAPPPPRRKFDSYFGR